MYCIYAGSGFITKPWSRKTGSVLWPMLLITGSFLLKKSLNTLRRKINHASEISINTRRSSME